MPVNHVFDCFAVFCCSDSNLSFHLAYVTSFLDIYIFLKELSTDQSQYESFKNLFEINNIE